MLQFIAQREKDPKLARECFNELYVRFNEDLVICCISLCRRYSNTDKRELAQDLFQETLITVFINAGNFDAIKGHGLPDSKVVKWMKGIARNELKVLLRRRGASQFSVDPFLLESLELFTSEDDKRFHNPLYKKLFRALKSFPEREQELIYSKFLYYPSNIPTSELDRLSSKYGLTRSNIRKIISRILNKIKKSCLS